MTNYLGLAFLATFDMFTEVAFAQILAIPLNFALTTREINNRMYRPSAYYTANLLSAITTYAMYPVISCCLPWGFLQLTDHSFNNLLSYIGVSLLLAICGLNFGIMISTMVGNPLIAIII